MATKSDGTHALACCKDCGAMSTPVDGEWYACHCGGTILVFPYVMIREDMWKMTDSDKRLMKAICIDTAGF